MPLSDLPPEVRPRERMLSLGPAALTDCELLAIVLRFPANPSCIWPSGS